MAAARTLDVMTSSPAPLVVTADAGFAETARRWCAAAGVEAQVRSDPGQARQAWRGAPLVLVDGRLAATVARLGLPRRDGVLLVGDGSAPDWRMAVELGACVVVGPHDDAVVVEALIEALDGRGEACVVTVVGACGGVGASSLAACTAQLAAGRGLGALLLDADRTAGGIELVTGAERAPGLRWADLDGAVGQVGARELADAVPVHGGVATVSFDRRDTDVRAPGPVVAAAVRGFDVVVADVPRHLDPLGREVVARSVLTVVVVPRRLAGVAAAGGLIDRLRRGSDALALVTRADRGGIPVARVGRELELPVLADVGTCRRLAADLEHGIGPGRARPVARAGRAVLDAVGLR